MWRPKEHLHEVLGVTITAATSIFDTQITIACQQWDDGLMESMFMIYQHVQIHATIITQVLMKNLLGCAYSTVAPFQETPMTEEYLIDNKIRSELV